MRRLTAMMTPTICSALMFSCGSTATVDTADVNNAKIYQRYRVDYSAETKSLRLVAKFTVGDALGTTLRLSSPAMIRVNGEDMELVDGDQSWLGLTGSYYLLTREGVEPEPTYTFRFTDAEGRTFENTVGAVSVPTLSAPVAGSQIPGDVDLQVRCDDRELGADEAFEFWLNSHDLQGHDHPAAVVLRRVASGNQATFAAEDLSPFQGRDVTLQVRRVKQTSLQQGHPEIGGFLSYRTESVPVRVFLKQLPQ